MYKVKLFFGMEFYKDIEEAINKLILLSLNERGNRK